MIYPIYSIRDKLIDFQGISLNANDASAMRSFREVFMDVKFPEDYSLYKLGTFDTTTGIVTAFKEPELICTGMDIAKEKNNNEI